MTKEQIIALDCKKHVKIYKLSKLGLAKREIAEAVGTNYGHVYNVLKEYEASDEKKQVANSIA